MMLLAIFLASASLVSPIDPATTNFPSTARICPVATGIYRLVQPDGQRRLFSLVDAASGTLLGPRPWVGQKKKNRIDVWADPTLTGGGEVKAGFTFLDGQLRAMKSGKVSLAFPRGVPAFEDRLEDLFPAKRMRSMEKNSAGDLWKNDLGRIRLWFANPNSAGFFFAELVLVFLGCLSWISTRHIRRFAVGMTIPALAAFFGLLKTGSRGALLGCLIGLVVLMAPHVKAVLTRKGLVILGLAMLVAGGAILASGQGERLRKTMTSVDAGNALRIKVARAAVEMFADAPHGWRGGEVPGRQACLNWYLFDEDRTIRTHLMSLAELGWFKGGAAVFGWLLMLALGFLMARRGDGVFLSLILAFGLAGFLNPVTREWELWALPLVAAGFGLRRLRGISPRLCLSVVGCSAMLATLTVGSLVVVGKSLPRKTATRVLSKGPATFVNGARPSVWIVEDIAVLGGLSFPGREILAYYRRHPEAPAVAYVYELEDLPPSVDTLVLPGRAAAEYLKRLKEDGKSPCTARRIVFLSPSVGPDLVPESLLAGTRVEWIAGYFAAAREQGKYGTARPWVRLRLDCELFLPNWLGEILAERTKGG